MRAQPCWLYILVSLHSQTRNFLPKDRNTIIKQHLSGEGLPSLLPLLQVYVFQEKQSILQQIILRPSNKPKKLVSGLLIQIISSKVLHESTTILQLKVYIVYVMRKLVGHPPWQECPINLLCFFSHLSAMQDLWTISFFYFSPWRFTS